MSDRSAADALPAQSEPSTVRRRLSPLPLVLLILALGDLRTPLQLLFDHFTVTTLLTSVVSHPLAVVVLVAQPSLWRRYGSRR